MRGFGRVRVARVFWRHPALSNLRLDTGGQLDFCEGRVARARRYGARALILGRSLRTPSQKPNCSAGALARSALGVGRHFSVEGGREPQAY